MNVKCIKVGYLEANCYIIKNNNNVLIVDPGDEVNKIIDNIGNSNVCAILITHYHFDHIGCLQVLKDKYNTKVIDYNNSGEEINIDAFNFKVISTKGHTSDSVSFYFEREKLMFTGDFLFKESIGRTDFENSNYEDMINSIKLIKTYPDDITIYPGHGESSTSLHEKQNNIFYNIN